MKVYDVDGVEIVPDQPGRWYTVDCSPAGGTSYTYIESPPAVDPATLAERARRTLPLSTPAVRTSPIAAGDQLVGVPTWLWLEGPWRAVSATASVPGVSSTVTAVPVSVRWDMGNGDEVVCDGPGTPYRTSLPYEAQSTDCSYTYRRSSAAQPGERYQATATATWRVSWEASGAPGGGSLGLVTRSASVELRVAEAQALNR